MKALALDFDGVISDSARESFAVSLRTYLESRPGSRLAGGHRKMLFRDFVRLMPLGNRAEDYGTTLVALERGRALADQAPVARPKTELICIVDTVDAGILVYRDIKRSWLLPSSRLFHWAKRMFERHYLRVFRA